MSASRSSLVFVCFALVACGTFKTAEAKNKNGIGISVDKSRDYRWRAAMKPLWVAMLPLLLAYVTTHQAKR